MGMKGHLRQRLGRILLNDNTSGGAIMLPPVMFFSAGFWISSGLPCIRICIADHKHAWCRLAPDCPECHYCISRDVSVCHWANVIVRLSSSVQNVGSPTLPQGCWNDAGVVWNSADWITSIFVRTSLMVSSATWHEVAFLNNIACTGVLLSP